MAPSPAWRTTLVRLLTTDYLPQVNPYIRWMWKPAGALSLAAVASGLCGLFLHPHGLVLMSCLLAILAMGVAWPWASLRGLGGSLAFEQDRAREGEAVGIRVALRNRLPWGCWGISIDAGSADVDGLAHVGGWKTVLHRGIAVPERRGEYPTRPIRVRSGFPFGIWEPGRGIAVEHPLIVWPRTSAVGPIPQAAGSLSSEGLVSADRPGHSGDFAGVRGYRRGDSLRQIHWPQTARHNRLIVCDAPGRHAAVDSSRPGRRSPRPPRSRAGRLARVGDPHRRELPGTLAGRRREDGSRPRRAGVARSRRCRPEEGDARRPRALARRRPLPGRDAVQPGVPAVRRRMETHHHHRSRPLRASRPACQGAGATVRRHRIGCRDPSRKSARATLDLG